MLQDANKIDLTSQSESEIKLVIADAGSHPETERDALFKKKATAYANYIKSPKFRQDFEIKGKTVVIELVSPVEPSSRMTSVMNSLMRLPGKDDRFSGIQLETRFKNQASPDQPATSSPPSQMGSVEQNELLMRGPSLIFILVAAADGKIDKKEVKAFTETLVAAEEFGSRCPLLGQALNADNAIAGINSYMEQIGNNANFNPVAELESIHQAAESTFSPEHCEAYTMGLLFIGKHIAEASGGFLGLFGSKISKGEKTALGMIAYTLQIAKYVDE